MSTANAPRSRFRGRRLARVVVLLALGGIAAWQIRVHTSAWSELKEGRAALERDDLETARRHLDACLEAWPRSARANYLAAQAARRSGDLSAAKKYLLEADRCGRAADDIEVENALIEVQSGHLAVAESALLHHLNHEHSESPRILAVLIPAYMAQYRWGEAGAFGQQWVELCPNEIKAWKAHAEILERLGKNDPAIDALRHVVQLAPNDRKARLDLARLILQAKQPPDEAARHAEWLVETDPRDAAALVQLAACRDAQSRTEEAISLLDQVIAGHSTDPKAFHYRGQVELHRGSAAAALPFLRRAAELDPSDPEILYTLFQSLQRTGTLDQISEAEKRWRQCTADLQRARDLGKAISASPHDPELRREMGELFLRNQREKEGLRWLESALRERPEHVPTHRVLAVYYEQIGQRDRAAQHRAFLQMPAHEPTRP
jgi:tetratricopeptide (TPR) repeat protein